MDKVPGAPGLQPGLILGGKKTRGQKHPHPGVQALKGLQHLVTVLPGQIKVQDHQVHCRGAAENLHRLGTVPGHLYAVSEMLQQLFSQAAEQGVVIHQQNGNLGHSPA